MPIISTQVIPVHTTIDGVPVNGSCTVIKHQHPKADPKAQGVPQREVSIMNESGVVILRIKKFFRHSLLECGDSFATTEEQLQLTPENVQRLAEHVLAEQGDDDQILRAAIAELQILHS